MPDPACERLYRADPFLIRFQARVMAAASAGDGTARIEIDRTAFYPTGGGQPFDTGLLAGLPVVDVREADEGRIVHVVRVGSARLPAVGEEVAGEIDWIRRFDHMQQHTGQHILSRAFEQVASAVTRSFHLGDRASTIDIALAAPTVEILRRAEALSNETIAANVAVTVTHRPASDAATWRSSRATRCGWWRWERSTRPRAAGPTSRPAARWGAY